MDPDRDPGTPKCGSNKDPDPKPNNRNYRTDMKASDLIQNNASKLAMVYVEEQIMSVPRFLPPLP